MSKVVFIEESCFAALVASCLETPRKETGGFLIGKEEKRFIDGARTKCLTLNVAYPVQTRRSGRGYWQPGNLRAYSRIVDSIRSMGFDIVGEYHSHIEDVAELSKEDKDFIEDELKDFERKGIKVQNWIEMVIDVNKREYDRKQKRGCRCRDLVKRVKCSLKGIRRPDIGYFLTIAAYWFDTNNLTYSEAYVHIP